MGQMENAGLGIRMPHTQMFPSLPQPFPQPQYAHVPQYPHVMAMHQPLPFPYMQVKQDEEKKRKLSEPMIGDMNEKSLIATSNAESSPKRARKDEFTRETPTLDKEPTHNNNNLLMAVESMANPSSSFGGTVGDEVAQFKAVLFNCLPFMTLEGIANVCANAPLPVFVENANSELIYSNLPFRTIICKLLTTLVFTPLNIEESEVHEIYSSSVSPLPKDGNAWLLQQKERTSHVINTRLVSATRGNVDCEFTKQWTTASDGQILIITLVTKVPLLC
jgi:hypothetical protein